MSIERSPTYLHPVRIRPEDVDHMGHVNNAVYIAWVQDAVTAHWIDRAPAEAVDQYLWVALRHEITYLRPALPGDAIVAESIARSNRGARVVFTTFIRRGDEVLAEVQSTWCCLDTAMQRPARLPPEIVERFIGAPSDSPE